MHYSRRTLIIGAGLATATPKIVKAQSLLDMPGGGIVAAQRWATESFSENPGCRLVFSDGSAYNWMTYGRLYRTKGHAPELREITAYAVALEVCVTDAQGRRIINSVPVDGVGLTRMKEAREAAKSMQKFKGWTSAVEW